MNQTWYPRAWLPPKCLISCSALVAQPAAGQLLTPLIRESADATFENCSKSDTEKRGAFGTRVVRTKKRTLLRQKSSVFWQKGRWRSCLAVSYVYTERPCRAARAGGLGRPRGCSQACRIGWTPRSETGGLDSSHSCVSKVGCHWILAVFLLISF